MPTAVEAPLLLPAVLPSPVLLPSSLPHGYAGLVLLPPALPGSTQHGGGGGAG